MTKTHLSNGRIGALAGAVALLCGLANTPAYALGLGRITVQSALGEALRAEIDVPEINADEAASLRVGVAPPAAFKAAGLEYSAAVVGVQVTLQKRADGRSYLSLSSTRPVTEPFVDLIVEANWASGRLVRDYTLLFDPPNMRQPAAAASPVSPTAPALPRALSPSATLPSPAGPANSQANGQANTRPAPMPKAAAQPAAPKPVMAAKPTPSGQQVAVKAGDTAGKIAAQNKPASISLDQMLVALLRSNPDAFIAGNINRLKSGAVLDIPTAEDAAAMSPGEASKTIVAQSKNFNDFRQKLASSVPATQVEGANRQAGGKVQAKVEDRAASAATPDKLTLSKGALQGKSAGEEKIAKDKQAIDASTRVAELSKNIGDLNKVAGGAPAAAASAAKGAAVAVAVPAIAAVAAAPAVAASASKAAASAAVAIVAPATPAVSTTAVVPAMVASAAAPVASAATAPAVASTSSAPAAPSSAALPASAAVAPAPVVAKKPVVVAPPPPEPSMIDQLTENPLVLPGLGLLLAGLAGFGYYRSKKNNNPASVDSSFLESRLQPDSFFGASGGQRIDTSEGSNATGSSMVYSPSQLDAAGDVDPVAEADVYLAYGRDLQAEEILKEALRTNPSRVAIHAKLMEIYAKRRDLKGFESIASEAYGLTNGNGPEWAYISEMGRDLDPTNPMYQPGGQPEPTGRIEPVQTAAVAASYGADTVPQMVASKADTDADSVDFDLDLDFSADDAPVAVIPVAPKPKPEPVYTPEATKPMQAVAEPVFEGLDMDFGASTVATKPSFEAPKDNGLSFTAQPAPVAVKTAAAAPAVLDSGMLEFDMGSLSLDLDSVVTESPTLSKAVSPAVVEGPLETKFALAEEFRALGDSDGARSLASEVVAQAQGTLKTKAQAFLNALS